MSLASMMLSQKTNTINHKIEAIPIEYIRTSEFNKMPIINIDDLAAQIETNGLQNPIHVRQIGDNNFIVIGGERRLTACKKLKMETINCIVRNDITTDRDEKLAVAINNVQREETKEVLQVKIFEWAELYEEEKQLGNIKGIRRADWIAQFTNCSRSTVQRYLKQYEKIEGNDIKKKANAKKSIEMKDLQNRLSQFIGSKAIVTNKSITFKVADADELNRVLQTIGFDVNQ